MSDDVAVRVTPHAFTQALWGHAPRICHLGWVPNLRDSALVAGQERQIRLTAVENSQSFHGILSWDEQPDAPTADRLVPVLRAAIRRPLRDLGSLQIG